MPQPFLDLLHLGVGNAAEIPCTAGAGEQHVDFVREETEHHPLTSLLCHRCEALLVDAFAKGVAVEAEERIGVAPEYHHRVQPLPQHRRGPSEVIRPPAVCEVPIGMKNVVGDEVGDIT